MSISNIVSRGVLVGVLATAGTLVGAGQPAQAQDLFEWLSDLGGGANGVSDRREVAFSPSYPAGQIIVSFGDRRLYHVVARGRAISYPIAIPRADARWSGTLSVSSKRVNPPWTPTAEMRRKNPTLPAHVVGGHPRNPLGVRALYLGSSMYRIHGTDAPYTIGKNVSSGCVRMHNAHVVELYNRVPVGTKVTATWRRFSAQPVAQGGGLW